MEPWRWGGLLLPFIKNAQISWCKYHQSCRAVYTDICSLWAVPVPIVHEWRTALSIAPMKTPNAMPRTEPITPDTTVFTAQLFMRSSCASCSAVVGSSLVYSFFFFCCVGCDPLLDACCCESGADTCASSFPMQWYDLQSNCRARSPQMPP